ncbi:transmembrane protein 15-related [Holotrichia oblita]|uniref:Transmembrane protein 15-related n=1 Tax=Holotrichia oblita TaxID=644536 RepID=A0ACB9SVG2_HOLOL|nr:transmembrane protein 15-related [Holotrichia oblita]
MSVIIIIFILLLPLHLLLKQSPVLWIFGLLTKDINTLLMFAYWVLCSGCATYAVSKQIKVAKKASTVIRKSFHILAILVFLPGLLFECIFIYLASGVTLGIFIILELLRNLNIPPLGTSLQDGFMVFSDEKDIGNVALTPIYLLIGCAIPLWIHPIPCDVTNSAMFNILPLVSGLLSVGIGDTMASYVGNLFGKHKWPGTNKTIEGTVGCILSQFLTVYLLFKFGKNNYNNKLYKQFGNNNTTLNS